MTLSLLRVALPALLAIATLLGCQSRGSSAGHRPGSLADGGSGGTGGGNGSGEGGTGGGAGEDIDPLDWILDDRLWPIESRWSAIDEMCVFQVAAPEALAMFPTLEWTPCGPGCESTALERGVGGMPLHTSTGRDYHGDVFLSVRHHFDGFAVDRVVDVRSGKTIAAFRHENHPDLKHCSVILPPTAPLYLRVSVSPTATTSLFLPGRIDPETGSIWIREPVITNSDLPPECKPATVGPASGPILVACIDTVLGMLEPGSSNLTLISRRKVLSMIAAAGDRAVYKEGPFEGQSRLLQWTGDEGEEPASSWVEGHLCAVGAGNRFLAGALYRQPLYYGCGGPFDEMRFVVRDPSSDDLGLTMGPPLPRPPIGPARVETWGPFVAATLVERLGQEGERPVVVLTRVDDWTTRFVAAHPGQKVDILTLGLDDTYLYVVENPTSINDRYSVAGFYRYELAKFESLGSP
jgi:hypothetical protein